MSCESGRFLGVSALMPTLKDKHASEVIKSLAELVLITQQHLVSALVRLRISVKLPERAPGEHIGSLVFCPRHPLKSDDVEFARLPMRPTMDGYQLIGADIR